MKNLTLHSDPEVALVFANYPKAVRTKLLSLRKLVLEVAEVNDQITALEETLKWGEPSYLTKHGSTLRMDWKPKAPNQYAMYFKCTSRLVETFKLVFPKTFQYEAQRAIVFQMNDDIPTNELKACIQAALTYHKVKHLPTLGI